jgi:hypothetical protein
MRAGGVQCGEMQRTMQFESGLRAQGNETDDDLAARGDVQEHAALAHDVEVAEAILPARALDTLAGEREVKALDEPCEHDAHLEHREVAASACRRAVAEGKESRSVVRGKGCALRLRANPALGKERVGVGEVAGVALSAERVERDLRLLRDDVRADDFRAGADRDMALRARWVGRKEAHGFVTEEENQNRPRVKEEEKRRTCKH